MQIHSLQYHGSVGICHSYQFGINGYKWNGKEFAIWHDVPRPSKMPVQCMDCECEHSFCIHEICGADVTGESQCGMGAVVYSTQQ